MDDGDDAVEGTRCGRCGRHCLQGCETCPLDGGRLTRVGTHDEPTVLLSRSMVAEARSAEPLDEHDDTATDLNALDGARDVGGTTSTISSVAAGPISEITVQIPSALESESPLFAAPASDLTTATRLDPSFHLVRGVVVDEIYEIEALLGAGAMGEVYAARHLKLGKRVAIKVIGPRLSEDAGAIERFTLEAVALARLSHPNVVDVLGIGTLPGDGRAYFVMAWLDGETLQARLARGRFSLDDAVDVLDQTARGLEAAHAAGIIHRDLKPDNVMLQRVGTEARPLVRIVDLGLAKLAQHQRSEETGVHALLGTSAYMSPEQCRSARDVDHRTDIYALGCVAYELLCGRLPFTHSSAAELVAAHITEEPPRPRQLAPQMDSALDEMLFAMLSKDPSRRPTVAQVREALASSRSAARIEARRPAAPSVASRPPRAARRSHAVLGAGVTLLVVIVVVALAARGRTEDPRAERREDDSAKNHRAAVPIDAPAPVVVSAPAIDASVAAPHVDAGRGTATSRRKSRSSPADAGIADDDASSSVPASLDAGQPETPASAIATEVDRIEPAPRHQAPPPENKPSKMPDKKRMSLERGPDRNQTFNPFKKQP